MLLSRLFGWFQQHRTLSVFALEILAVFIGITGSLLVDQWRQERADYETLDNELRILRFNIERTLSNETQIMNVVSNSLDSAVLLAFGDTSRLSDDELLEHFWSACFLDIHFGEEFVLAAGNTSLSIPFNETLSLIEATMDDLRYFDRQLRSQMSDLRAHVDELIDTTGLVRNASGSVSALKDADLTSQVLSQFAATGALDSDTYVAGSHNRATVRAALDAPATRAQLRQLVPMLQAVGVFTVSSIQIKRDIIEFIRRYSPGLTLPVTEVGIDGSGTLFDWQTYIAMQQDEDDPDVWRITLDLLDGEVKFRADRAWAINWGTQSDTTQSRAVGDEWTFGGNIGDVFPRGTAVLNGTNIPVRAGRYDITFNTRTLEYSFVEAGTVD